MCKYLPRLAVAQRAFHKMLQWKVHKSSNHTHYQTQTYNSNPDSWKFDALKCFEVLISLVYRESYSPLYRPSKICSEFLFSQTETWYYRYYDHRVLIVQYRSFIPFILLVITNTRHKYTSIKSKSKSHSPKDETHKLRPKVWFWWASKKRSLISCVLVKGTYLGHELG